MRRDLEFLAIGLVAGAAMGYVAGVLLAPRSGAATRRRLAMEARRASQVARDLADRAERAAEVLSGQVDRYLGREEEVAWRRVREIREGLEGYAPTRG